MRINTFKPGSRTNPLLLHWAALFSEEYQITEKVALKYVIHSLDPVTEFLKQNGWQVESYRLSPLPDGVEMEYEITPVRSQGYIVAEDCEKYVEFRLRQE